MFVGLGRFDLRLPDCNSLKDKRSVVRGVVTLVRKKFNAAVAEVDHQDLWQRTTIAVSVVSDSGFHVRRMLSEVERHMETAPGVEMLGSSIDLLAPGDE